MNTEHENPNAEEDGAVAAIPASPAEPQQLSTQPVSDPRPAQSFDPRRRLRELLSVPERDRTDEQWDEINELEIQLAPGNRVHPGQAGPGGMPSGGGGRHFQQKKHAQKGEKGGGGGGGGGKRRQRPGGGNPNKQPG
jgi:hypothetical protein